jgi:hypothetical protein
VSRNRVFLFLGIGLTLLVAYEVTRFLFEVGHKTLGVRRGSVSQTQSKSAGFYVGTYVPTKRLVALNDLSVIQIPDAWVEHAWKAELSLVLRETKRVADGYYVYIPIPADESPGGRKPIWKFAFTLELQEKDGARSSYRGTGFDSGLGFYISLDMLPDRLIFGVKQKQREDDNWNNAIITDTIEFKRAF